MTKALNHITPANRLRRHAGCDEPPQPGIRRASLPFAEF